MAFFFSKLKLNTQSFYFRFQARIQTACELIERIGKHRGELVQHMRSLCEAYIELAYVNVTHLKNERGTRNLRCI